MNTYLAQATSDDEKYSHIDAGEKQTIIEKCATVQKWLDDQLARQAERPKNVDPAVSCSEILKKKDEVIYFASPILNRSKPKPKADPSANGTETPKSRTETPDPSKGGEQAKGDEPSEMDVD